MTRRASTRFLLLVAVLGGIASLSPLPHYPTDAGIYDRLGREWFIPRCSELHCSRVLMPWILGLLPGASAFKWKAAAVLLEAGAAVAMERWVLRLGAAPRAASQVMWLTALGSGSLYTFFDPHTPDPLMHLLGPLLMLMLFNAQFAAAIGVSLAGVFAKEFAAVPLLVAGLIWWQQRRGTETRIAAVGFLLVVAVWLAWMIGLRLVFGYSYEGKASADVMGGGFLVYWLARLSPFIIVSSIFMTLGMLWILWPAGLVAGPRALSQLTLAALPCILAWCYVQQPDRALWNFAFVVMPAAAVVLDRVSAPLGWALVGAQALANLRVGAQLPIAPPSRFTFTLAAGLAMIAVWQALRGERTRLAGTGA